jgi:hypothetical protein
MAAGAASLLLASATKLGLFSGIKVPFTVAIYALYVLAAVLALVSFGDYLIQYRKLAAPRP